MPCVRLQLKILPPPIRARTVLAGPPLQSPCVRTLWMNLVSKHSISKTFYNTKKEPLMPSTLIENKLEADFF